MERISLEEKVLELEKRIQVLQKALEDLVSILKSYLLETSKCINDIKTHLQKLNIQDIKNKLRVLENEIKEIKNILWYYDEEYEEECYSSPPSYFG